MGFEIKNICTIVPNQYHENYDKQGKYYYFSVFVSPRLQLDGRLKEFYEMLHWPDYRQIKTEICVSTGNSTGIIAEIDDTYQKKIEKVQQIHFETEGKRLWGKLFTEDTPVEASPVFLTPVKTSFELTPDEIRYLYKKSSAVLGNVDSQTVRDNIKDIVNQCLGTSIPSSTPSTSNYDPGRWDFITGLGRKAKVKRHYEQNMLSQEFHKKMSVLARYPHLLRMLGMIWDFKIKKPINWDSLEHVDIRLQFDKPAIDKLSTDHVDLKEFLKSVDFICPQTRCYVSDGKLKAFDRQYRPEGSKTEVNYREIVRDGFLDNKVFSIGQEYHEDNPGGPSGSSSDGRIGINGRTLGEDDLEVLKKKAGGGSRYSKGFAISVNAENAELLVNLDSALNELSDEKIENIFAFKAHHLDCGYRVDVRKLGDCTFHSLCGRKATYKVDSKKDHFLGMKDDFTLFPQMEDEPWLEEIRQVSEEGKPGRAFEITRWNNWSLTCQRLNAPGVAHDEYDALTLTSVRPVPMPRLRFGGVYEFRIRTVDLCGNGPKACSPDSSNTIVCSEPYKRMEPLAPPLFFPPYEIVHGSDLGKKGYNLSHKGEDNETLVIRSRRGDDGKRIVLEEYGQCLRFLTPEHVTITFAEASRLLDGKWTSPEYLFEWLSAEPKHFYLEQALAGGVPFVTDNGVEGFLIGNREVLLCNLNKEPKIHAITLILDEKGLHCKNSPEKSPGYLTDLLPGEFKQISVNSYPKNGVEVLAPLTKTFRIIHAVQRPCYLSQDIAITKNTVELGTFIDIEKVTPDPTNPLLRDQSLDVILCSSGVKGFKFPVNTSGEFVLVAEYQELRLDKDSVTGLSPIMDENGKPANFYIRKAISNICTADEKDHLQTIRSVDENLNAFIGQPEDFLHTFPSPRYYKDVKYSISAISKYASYFDLEKHWFRKEETDPFSITGSFYTKRIGIKNSAKPSKPKISSIVPILKQWPPKDDIIYELSNPGFRLWLGETWYETGPDEKIAVIHEATADTVKDLRVTSQNTYKNQKISLFANDPTTSVDDTTGKVINEKIPYIQDTVTPPHALNTEIFENTVEKPGTGTTPHTSHQFSVFLVEWDKCRGEFFCDIQLAPEAIKGYSYLLKFAVCRYQEQSIFNSAFDYRFSDVIMTDMVCTLPKRWITKRGQQYFIHGIPGSRWVYPVGTKEPDPVKRDNQFYLIEEHECGLEPGLSKLPPSDLFPYKVTPICNQQFQLVKEKKKGKDKKLKRFVEEYEHLEVNDVFIMNPSNHYNPRTDPRMRLVFFYELKN